ncbi:MAG: nuclear transport factor 2 family protein [Acidimicrobiales bacterium]
MTRFGQRLERDLRDIAENGAPSEGGWDRIRARIDEHQTEPNHEFTTLEVDDRPAEKGRSRLAIGLMGAAAVLLAALAVGSFLGGDDDETLAANAYPLVVVELYIQAFNAGDVSNAISMFTDDATLRDGDGTSTASPTVDQWESLLSWYAAQNAQISDSECETTDLGEQVTTVRCRWQLHDAITEAIGRPGDPVEIEWTVDAGRIVGFDRTITWSVQPHASFAEWVSDNRSDDYATVSTFPFQLSPDEATDAGKVVKQHAPDWADYYINGPTPETVDE